MRAKASAAWWFTKPFLCKCDARLLRPWGIPGAVFLFHYAIVTDQSRGWGSPISTRGRARGNPLETSPQSAVHVTFIRKLAHLFPFLAFVVLAGCATVPTQAPDEVSRLAAGIMALNPSVDPEEAQRAAQISITYPWQLRREYGVTDPPLIHNMKVNAGTRPRGLCWQWADDMQARLAQENFQTLRLHRAIANADSRILIDHSTVIIAAVGDDMFDGMVLDPWRYGGTLFWAPTREDAKYTWVPRQKVFAMRRARLNGQAYSPPRDPSTEPLPAGF